MSNKTMDEFQQAALAKALRHDVDITFIIGMAGAGKSFTVNEISKALASQGWQVSLAAPTGRAAKRINGKTIHMWLQPIVKEDKYGEPVITGYDRLSFGFKECLIVDESSMIDSQLWGIVMDIFNNSVGVKKIIFVGDTGQLEPVGDGTPFIDMIHEMKDMPDTVITELKGVHRTKEGNDILDFALAIRNKTPLKAQHTNVLTLTPAEAIDMVAGDTSIQMICPMKDGAHGINTFNETIHQRLIQSGVLGDKLFSTLFFNRDAWKWLPLTDIYVGDKIVLNKNNWASDVNMTNGTVGIVTKREMVKKEVFTHGYVTFQWVDCVLVTEIGETEGKWIPVKWLSKNCQLAYAISVHKAQGSEWEKVILSWREEQTRYGNDKMLYTAATRAKDILYIIN